MGKPRSLRSALAQGFRVINIYDKGNKEIRVTLERNFRKADDINSFDIWINRAYFQRNYPNSFFRYSRYC